MSGKSVSRLVVSIIATILISIAIWYISGTDLALSSSLLPDLGILVDASIIIASDYAIVELLSRAAYRVALVASNSVSATSIRSTIKDPDQHSSRAGYRRFP
ncbi:MAG: hypothetical protein DJ555_05225 [Desulfurococcaceae archaeon]|nr:MAG: hypothetical protein DJ555_05225 [Desulfurococcaceae archaeon]